MRMHRSGNLGLSPIAAENPRQHSSGHSSATCGLSGQKVVRNADGPGGPTATDAAGYRMEGSGHRVPPFVKTGWPYGHGRGYESLDS